MEKILRTSIHQESRAVALDMSDGNDWDLRKEQCESSMSRLSFTHEEALSIFEIRGCEATLIQKTERAAPIIVTGAVTYMCRSGL
jgi:hypothetical protein